MAEAQTRAGTATVTRALAEDINSKVVPGDRVSGESLAQRVRQKEGLNDSKIRNPNNNPEPKKQPSIQDKTIYGLNKNQKNPVNLF